MRPPKVLVESYPCHHDFQKLTLLEFQRRQVDMTNEMKRSYIMRVQLRYLKSTKPEKTLILDEFCQVFSITRKHAIRLLSQLPSPVEPKPGPKKKYGREVTDHLVYLWLSMSKMCSKKMVVAVPLWLEYYDCPDAVRERLNTISASTIDRLLKPHRKQTNLRGISSTTPSLIKNKIPVNFRRRRKRNWIYRGRYGGLHRNALSGEFTNSLTMTDLHSGS